MKVSPLTRSPVSFYLPREKWLFDQEPAEVTPAVIEQVGNQLFDNTSCIWTLQTYLRLRARGYPCRLVDEIPGSGVTVVARGDLPFDWRPSPSQFFVCCMADGGYHPWSQLQVVQNPVEATRVPGGTFLHHWPQPGLIPRDSTRGDRLDTVAYFGNPSQMAAELKSQQWEHFLADRNMQWRPVHRESSNNSDYSCVDIVVAVRSFDGKSYDGKPASKLHNAWRAGVPAILGPESAYRAERTSDDDYLEVTSYRDLEDAVDRLVQDKTLWQRMVERAHVRSRDVSFDRLTTQWANLLDEAVIQFGGWSRMSRLGRASFFTHRYARVRARGIQARFRALRRLV